MKFQLPTQHVLYFGLQAKRGKLAASGVSTANIAEIFNQVTIMLGHECATRKLADVFYQTMRSSSQEGR
jgi:hypothetical protein